MAGSNLANHRAASAIASRTLVRLCARALAARGGIERYVLKRTQYCPYLAETVYCLQWQPTLNKRRVPSWRGNQRASTPRAKHTEWGTASTLLREDGFPHHSARKSPCGYAACSCDNHWAHSRELGQAPLA